MENYCKNCGAKLSASDQFCPECGTKTQKINFCPNCGAELTDSVNFCESCGQKINKPSPISKLSFDLDNKKLIILLLIVIVIILACLTLFASNTFKSDVPLETSDFDIFTMLTPVGSNYVATDSLPSYGDMGGYVLLENAGKYSNEVFSICVSTTQGESHPPEVSLYDQVGDITIYKDNQGNDAYYIVRHVGEYRFSLIGNDVETMIKMLNSIEITS